MAVKSEKVVKLRKGAMEFPLLPGASHEYAARSIDITNLSEEQAQGLKALAQGLMADGAHCSSRADATRPVRTSADAVRWLADRCYEALRAKSALRPD